MDALYPDKQYSSISVFDSYGHMVNSNSIRSEASKYEQFFNIIKENYNVKWLDLYEVSWEIMRKMELVISDIIEITIRDLLKDMFL